MNRDEQLIAVKGKCPSCGKSFEGMISPETTQFTCDGCSGIIPRVFCNPNYATSTTRRLDVLPD